MSVNEFMSSSAVRGGAASSAASSVSAFSGESDFARNKRTIRLSPGHLTMEEVNEFLVNLADTLFTPHEIIVATADHKSLLRQVVTSIVSFGGEIRSYKHFANTFKFKIGEQEVELRTGEVFKCMVASGIHSPYMLTRSVVKVLEEVIYDSEIVDYFMETYKVGPHVKRASLFPSGHAFKFDQKKISRRKEKALRESLEEVEEEYSE